MEPAVAGHGHEHVEDTTVAPRGSKDVETAQDPTEITSEGGSSIVESDGRTIENSATPAVSGDKAVNEPTTEVCTWLCGQFHMGWAGQVRDVCARAALGDRTQAKSGAAEGPASQSEKHAQPPPPPTPPPSKSSTGMCCTFLF